MRESFVVGLVLLGCAAAPRPEARAVLAREAACAEAHASVEVFPPGEAPRRPYKVIAPVAAPTSDASALRQRACALGAHAVIAVRERALPVDAHEMGGEAMTSTTAAVPLTVGDAIVYTDSPAN